MKLIKRDGREVEFDTQKIVNAITKANDAVNPEARIRDLMIAAIADDITAQAEEMLHTPGVEDIQDLVVDALHRESHAVEVAYIKYRQNRETARKANTTDGEILALVEFDNEEVKQENSNKDPVINSTQRDYIAGQVSRDITRRLLLPNDVVEAHNAGIIHFHKQNCGFAWRHALENLVNPEIRGVCSTLI